MNGPATLVPFPGIAWGAYPQRRAPEPGHEPAVRLARLMGRGRAGARAAVARVATGRDRRFARLVLDETVAHANTPRARLLESIGSHRASLARDGLRGAPLVSTLGLLGELSRREIGQAPYPTQIMAVRVMLGNGLAEMATGEGKTLAAGLCAAVGALAGIPVHLVTANDYLVERDRRTMGPLFDALGLTHDVACAGQSDSRRRDAWSADIVYTTARELAFDHLRDQLRLGRDPAPAWPAAWTPGDARAPVLRGLCMAILDEADSILLDEACTPLILAGPAPNTESVTELGACLRIADALWANRDFRIQRAYRRVELSAEGERRAEALAADGPARALPARDLRALVCTALAALHCYRARVDYLVEDDEVVMIDGPTGRKADGRSWSRGLQQMIELKEGLQPRPATRTFAQTTYQQFFTRYLRLCGMSGSLREAQGELLAVYGMTVRAVPLRLPGRRREHRTRIADGRQAKWLQVASLARAARARRRAVLLAVDSVASAAELSDALLAAGIPHRRLDATECQREAEIVAMAGQSGAVTVATNMAGRGTDIVLSPDVIRAGGLFTVVCHYNRERRLDRQMFGRAGRQGQPGDALRVVCVDDLAHFDADPRLCVLAGGIVRSAPGVVSGPALRALFRLAQRLTEIRQRRLRYRVLDAGRRRERLLAIAGSGQ